MNKKKWSRLSIVVEKETSLALGAVSQVSGLSVSAVVRHLIAEPAAMMADAYCNSVSAASPEAVRAIEDQVDMFVEGQYGEYLRNRGSSHA